MQIGLTEIDSQIASAIEDRMSGAAPIHAASATPEELAWLKIAVPRRGRLARPAAALLVSGFTGALLVSVGLTALNPASAAGILTGWAMMAGWGALAFQSYRQVMARWRASLPAEEVRALSRILKLTRAEQSYLEALALLLDRAETIGEETARGLLQQINDLLANSRRLTAQQEALHGVLGGGSILYSIQELEAEHAALARRVDEAAEPETRSVLQQSLGLCEERLRNARALEPALERLDAQQEVLCQTLSSVLAALARMKAAPAALQAPDVDEVRRSVSEMNLQSRAVEDAVQEVLALQTR